MVSFMVTRHKISGLVAALVLFAALTPVEAAAADSHADTCRYFNGQAFNDRRTLGAKTFRMELAQDCVDALVYLRSGDPEARARAEAYLDQLGAYRRVIVEMVVTRAQARPAPAEDRSRYTRVAVQPVSWAGAYLIARRMGLVETHRDWTAWRRAASLPLFRLDETQTN